MKKRNSKLPKILKGLLFGGFVVALLGLNVGCDKKKSDSNNNRGWWSNGGYYNYGSPGYGGNGQISTVAAGIGTNANFMVIFGVATDAGMGSGYINGPAYVEGELHLETEMSCGYVGMPRGTYRLYPRNNQPGYMSANQLSNASLIAVGPYGIEVELFVPSAFTFSTNVCGFQGMMGSMQIQYVDGQPCSGTLSFMDRGAESYCQ